MATPKQLIDRLREDFDCSFNDEKIVFMINSLESRIATDVLRDTDVLKVVLSGKEDKIALDFDAARVLALAIDGRQIRQSSINFPCGYRIMGNDILLDFKPSGGEAMIEYIKMPTPFSQADYEDRQLLLSDEFSEIYIYHILSREALLFDDIERLNNYSIIYSAALKSLASSRRTKSGGFNFANIW